MRNRVKIIFAVICIAACAFAWSYFCQSVQPVIKTESNTATNAAIVPVSSGSGVTKIESKADTGKTAVRVISGDIGKYLDVIDGSVISEICNSSDEKYVYIGNASNGVGIIASSKEELENIYQECAAEIIKGQGSGFQVESLNQMERDAIAVLKAISTNNELDPNISITYSGNDTFTSTAFGDHIGKSSNTKNSASDGKYDTKGHFEEAGLSLEMDNFNIEKVIGGESAARLGIITIVVSADTKCIENSGIYKDLSWIPNAGESRNIKYALQFWADCYNGNLHEVVIEDLSITE